MNAKLFLKKIFVHYSNWYRVWRAHAELPPVAVAVARFEQRRGPNEDVIKYVWHVANFYCECVHYAAQCQYFK